MNSNDAFPLKWPASWPRTEEPSRSPFLVSFSDARRSLLVELLRLGALDVVVSTNLETRRDGLPYANRVEPEDTGVAVYFELDGVQRCMPCDRWNRVKDNMRAIGLTVAALRGIERWTGGVMVDAAFQGFAALPAGDTSGEAWWNILELDRDATRAEIRDAYLVRVRAAHPDAGGSDAEFYKVQAAYEAAMKERT